MRVSLLQGERPQVFLAQTGRSKDHMTFRARNWTLERERKSATNGSLVVVREAVRKMISQRAGAAEKDRTIIVAMVARALIPTEPAREAVSGRSDGRRPP